MIHVAFNIDENFIDKCKVVMRSAVAHTAEPITFHIVGAKIVDKDFNIKCYPIPDTTGYTIGTIGEITTAAAYRLWLPKILNDLDKVIYIDGDTLVLQDLAELYRYSPKWLAGVADPMWRSQAGKNSLTHTYINSGVMLMNLKALRDCDFLGMCKKVQDEPSWRLTLYDQDIINIALGEKIQHLPEKWNVYAQIYPETTKAMMDARENPAIVHWCGPKKPWKSGDTWMKEEYKKYEK